MENFSFQKQFSELEIALLIQLPSFDAIGYNLIRKAVALDKGV